MEIKSKEIKLVSVAKVIPHPKNNNTHSKEQIEAIKKQIKYQGFRNPLVISNLSGLLVSGHARLEAAKELGMKKIPATYQDFENTTQEYAYLTADNAIASWAELDLKAISEDLLDLESDFDIDLLGIEDFRDFEEEDSGEDEFYTKKIEAPIYEPKGSKPKINELYDINKTNMLLEEIRKSSIDKGIKQFLEFAAMRHTVFNYEQIAEFYAHADKDTQELMERSALVIIDFKKAIENGFVVLSNGIAEAFEDEEQ